MKWTVVVITISILFAGVFWYLADMHSNSEECIVIFGYDENGSFREEFIEINEVSHSCESLSL